MFEYIEGITEIDYEYIVNDPVLGFVSCNDHDHALRYASDVGGIAYMEIWVGGKVIERVKLKEA